MTYNKEYDECPRCGKKGKCVYLCHDCMNELSGTLEEVDKMKMCNRCGKKEATRKFEDFDLCERCFKIAAKELA